MTYTVKFEEFWSHQIRKVAKGAAFREWKKAISKLNKLSDDFSDNYLITKWGLQKPYYEIRAEKENISPPHPRKWLYDERWDDKPEDILTDKLQPWDTSELEFKAIWVWLINKYPKNPQEEPEWEMWTTAMSKYPIAVVKSAFNYWLRNLERGYFPPLQTIENICQRTTTEQPNSEHGLISRTAEEETVFYKKQMRGLTK